MMKKKKLIFLSLALFSFLAFHPAPDFQAHYGENYAAALQFCEEEKLLISTKTTEHSCDAAVLMAIVFPELVRYNAFQNLFETTALELGYVNGGKSIADFSIGPFQMKPSFIETIETLVENAPQDSWAADFQHICSFDAGDENNIRQQRLRRLQDNGWQIDYLICYFKYAETQTDANLSAVEKIRSIATRYNCGPTKPLAELEKWTHRQNFPYGSSYPAEKQHCYADIAVDFYQKNALKIFHP